MPAFLGKLSLRVKRFILDVIVEPLISLRRLESYVISCARFVVKVRKPFIVGITGSVGKSTTTAMVATVLSHRDAVRIVGPVGHTLDNMNDDLGLSATLLRFDSFLFLPWHYHLRVAVLCVTIFRTLRAIVGRYPKVMVLEFGVGSTADFNRLVTIAPPNVAVVTRIGPAHLEKLKTLEGVVREKGTLVRAVPASGLVILGQDHDYVSDLVKMAQAPVVKVSGPGVELSRKITLAICRHMGVPDSVVSSALKDFQNPKRRLCRLEFADMTVIDDSYNANPLSMKLGLDTLAATARPEHRRLAILGYMGELGEEGPRYHEEVGAYARGRADLLIGCGELSKHYNPDIWFGSSEACAARIESLLRSDDCLLVKGSFTAKMDQVVNKLREIAEKRESVASRA